jgi:hypothetical protein
MSKKAAIAEVVKVRDQLVIIRERLFQLSAATAARTREVEGLLVDCAAAGRVFGTAIGLPDWNNVLAMPGHQSAPSLDYELQDDAKPARAKAHPSPHCARTPGRGGPERFEGRCDP